MLNTKKTGNVDLVHLALVMARKATGAACDKLLDAGVAWESKEYQDARNASMIATQALNTYSKAKNSEAR